MSDPAVRSAIRGAWSTLVPTVEFVETIDVPIDHANLPDTWGTLAFAMIVRQSVDISDRWIEEQGTISFVGVARSGSGDDAVMDVLDAIRSGFEGYRSQDNALVLGTMGAPVEVQQPNQEFVMFALETPYTYQTDTRENT